MNKYAVISIVLVLALATALWLARDHAADDTDAIPAPVKNMAAARPAPADSGIGSAPVAGASPARSLPAPAHPASAPEPPPAGVQSPDHLQLWDGPFETGHADQVAAQTFTVEPGKLEQLRTGQTLSFTLGERSHPITARVESTANPAADVQTWQGAVLDRQPQDNIIIARGPQQTHITVFTDATTYSVVIDNATGEASLVDEGDLHEITVPYEDGIALPEVPDSLPPL